MQHYRQGVLAVSYHPSHNMLFVAGPTIMKNADKLKVMADFSFFFNLMYNWCVKFVLSCHVTIILLTVYESGVVVGMIVPKHDALI